MGYALPEKNMLNNTVLFIMKRIILVLSAVILSAGIMSAQDMSAATEKAKAANESLVAKDYSAALSGFKEALTLAEACGEEGEEIANTCKTVIPSIILNIAKNNIKESKFDEGLSTLADAIKAATDYANDDVVAEATKLVSQAKKAKAQNLIKAKDYAGAVAAYKEVLAETPTDGASALQLGAALVQTGDQAGAIAAFEQALENGQAAAGKQLSNIYVKEAQTLLKDKKYKEALAACDKSNEYGANANACKLAANAATQLKDNKAAINYHKQYLEVSPEAKDAAGVAYTIAVLAQQLGDKATAKEFYTKVQGDATYGAEAKKQLETLK